MADDFPLITLFGARLFLRGKKSLLAGVRSVARTNISGREIPMRAQRARRFSRRRFLGGVTLAGTAGLLGLHTRRVAAEPPPETTRIQLVQIPGICRAPEYVAEALLRSEGFTEVHYLQKAGG